MMKQGSSNKRSRSRGNGKRHHGPRGRYESNGPEVKVRGTPQQILEKYLALGRDATASGDRIAAEGFFQFAEHYYRIVNAEGGNGAGGQNWRERKKERGSQSVAQKEVAAAAEGNPAHDAATDDEVEVEGKTVPIVEAENGAAADTAPAVDADLKQAQS
ncbi:MAG: DUF4167 domain-containing protein [Pseudomonadota bacterium]|nr:DUF4167 domain-containing protein [Pseudomonadota bacterium]